MSRSYPIFTALALLIIAGCVKEPDPTDPGGGGTNREVAVTRMAPLPADSGNTTGIAIASDNSFIALMEGRLVAIDAGGAIRTINADASHLAMAIAPSGEVYAITRTEFRRYDAATGSMVSAPIPTNGPLAANGRVEGAEIRFSPTGEPFVTIVSNFPRTYCYFSTDRGVTWASLKFPMGAANLPYTGDVIFMKNGDLLAGDYNGLFKSSDRGESWTRLPPQMPNFGIKMVAAGNGDIYRYIPGGGNLSVSHDGGNTFIDLTQSNAVPLFTSVQEGPDGALYALANRSAAGSSSIDRQMSFMRSTDGGNTWRHILFCQGYGFAMRGQTIAIAAAGADATFRRGPGGICISRDLGATWTTAGLSTAGTIQDFGFDADGDLMLIADNGLYRKTATGWTTLGAQPYNFHGFASSHGRMVVASASSFFLTTDDGATWTNSGEYPNYQPTGIGSITLSALLALRNGDFLISLTTYRNDLSLYTNGQLYRIGPTGVAQKITGVGHTFVSITEDADGVLHGREETLDPISVTMSSASYRSSDGNTWTLETAPSYGLAYNSAKRFFKVGGKDGASFSLGTTGSSDLTPLTLGGFNSLPQYVTKAMFGPDDRLYILTLDQGLFISNTPVK